MPSTARTYGFSKRCKITRTLSPGSAQTSNHSKSFKARLALIDFKSQFLAAFQHAETTISQLEHDKKLDQKHITDLAQREILSEFCERMVYLITDLNDQFAVNKLTWKWHR